MFCLLKLKTVYIYYNLLRKNWLLHTVFITYSIYFPSGKLKVSWIPRDGILRPSQYS